MISTRFRNLNPKQLVFGKVRLLNRLRFVYKGRYLQDLSNANTGNRASDKQSFQNAQSKVMIVANYIGQDMVSMGFLGGIFLRASSAPQTIVA